MGKGKSGKKGNQQYFHNNKANIPAPASASKGITIPDEEKDLYEVFKKTVKDMEPNRDAIKKSWEEMYEEVYNGRVEEIDKSLEEDHQKKERKFDNELKEKNADLTSENERLEKEVSEKKETVSQLEKKAENLEGERTKLLDEAKKKADKIVDYATKEAEKQNKAVLDKIDRIQKELDDREEKVEDNEIALEAKQKALEGKQRRVDKQAEVYDQANPDAIAVLQKKLDLRADQLAAVQKEYEYCQRELNQIRIQEIRYEGISPEELQSTNEALIKKVEELENKCNRYTEYQLSEMQRALDQEEKYIVQIKNLSIDVAERKNEVVRLNNAIQEFEQLKAQLDLLRTLNEHLRNELDNTKRMLESSVGEICPALTSIDIEEAADSGESFNKYEERQDNLNDGEIKTLLDVVSHVKRYAASQPKPLYYSDRDLRAFIAGLASSPIAILQGMSGTGKTSLPKVFCEGLMGKVCVVPVESSWRDRNELLGYYNDFSKKFTAKEFTCDLYRASCERYEDTLYFIVLDEMNLSRVEYYFADFLSILEDKKDKWLIKLVDTDMRQLPSEITPAVRKVMNTDRSEETMELLNIIDKLYPNDKLDDDSDTVAITANDKQRLITYLSNRHFKNKTNTRNLVGGPQNLIDGNTIRIPKNVWFIGTANRDESTFEITDKVYDRAQVLNFNERAKGTPLKEDVPCVFVTYDQLDGMFRRATSGKGYSFNAETNEVLIEVEAILKKYFRISYGNRIQDQMNIFVPVYVEAGKGKATSDAAIKKLENEAIDYQLTNKVLRKLEYEDIKKDHADKLRKVFEQYGLELAKEFIGWKTDGNEG